MSAKDRIHLKIRKLLREGYDHDQAVAIALSMAERGEIGPRGGCTPSRRDTPWRDTPSRSRKRRRNPSPAGSTVSVDAVRDYRRKHWGIDPDYVYQVSDPRLPDGPLIEMGKLDEIRVAEVDEDGKDTGQTMDICFPEDDRNLLAYDPKTHRLYCGYTTAMHRQVAKDLWIPDEASHSLTSVARRIMPKGRHGRRGHAPYPKVRVQSLGPVVHVVYHTHKKGHGPSGYIHHLGEDSGKRPDLCVSKDGALWWAGGNYTVKKHGIID